jgi:hypothetical protein
MVSLRIAILLSNSTHRGSLGQCWRSKGILWALIRWQNRGWKIEAINVLKFVADFTRSMMADEQIGDNE